MQLNLAKKEDILSSLNQCKVVPRYITHKTSDITKWRYEYDNY